MKRYPELMRVITLQLIKREKEGNRISQGEPALRMTYTLLPTSAECDLTTVADELAQELGVYGKTLVLTGD